MNEANNRVVIEVGDVAAGILVRGPRGFIFHSVHPQLNSLNGTAFSTMQAATNAARQGLRQLADAS